MFWHESLRYDSASAVLPLRHHSVCTTTRKGSRKTFDRLWWNFQLDCNTMKGRTCLAVGSTSVSCPFTRKRNENRPWCWHFRKLRSLPLTETHVLHWQRDKLFLPPFPPKTYRSVLLRVSSSPDGAGYRRVQCGSYQEKKFIQNPIGDQKSIKNLQSVSLILRGKNWIRMLRNPLQYFSLSCKH